jgi:exonuclease SbcC
MVIFKELEMEGFKKYNSKKTYKFNEGLIGIFGKNESGKSTIGDAISVALFGLSNTTYKKADIVTWGKLNSKIRLDFETDIIYRVERTLGNKSTAILKKDNNGRWDIISKTIKTVDTQIQDILGLDYKSFKNSIFIAQNDLNSLSSLNKMERQTIINKLSRYDELSKAEEILKEELKQKNINLKIDDIDFNNLKELVSDKTEKYKKLEVLREDRFQKNELLEKNKIDLLNIRNKISISIELKKIDDIYGKIEDLENHIGEKVNEISRIEDKESEKRTVEKELKKLDHINSELKYTVDLIKELIFKIGELESLKKEVKRLQFLIDEKVSEISRIEDKESEKRTLEQELKKLDHINDHTKDKIVNIGSIFTQIKKLLDVKRETKKDIEVLQKKVEERELLIVEKESEIIRIGEKETQMNHFEEELDKLAHHTPELSDNIERLTNIISELSSLHKELERLKKEKNLKYDLIKNEKDLKINYEKYNEILSLENNLNSLINQNELLKSNIKLKKEELGDLREEKGDLGQIENKYESGNSTANIFIAVGLFLILLGGTLGFIFNLFLIIISIIGIVPIYKGYKDRVYFKKKLSEIKEKREVFGQLKQLEIQLYDIKNEQTYYKKRLENYDEITRESLRIDHETFENLNKEKITIKKLDDDENSIQKKIKEFEKDLNKVFQIMPYHYQKAKSIADINLDKELSKIYQEEDKKKSNYETSIQELNKEITRKPKIIEEKEKLEKEKLEFETQIYEKIDKKRENLEKKQSLNMELKKEFESLPAHYKDIVSIDDLDMDKEISKIYQEEDKKKTYYLTTIDGLYKEILRKPKIKEEMEKLRKEKHELKDKIIEENERLNEDLKYSYNNLPAHYKDIVSIDDLDMDKEISKIYQEEDKKKSNYGTSIHELNKEITRKPKITEEKEKLEKEKQKLEYKVSELKTGLKALTDEEDLEYNTIKHLTFEKDEKTLGENINKFERRIGDLEGEIRTLNTDTIDLDEKRNELNILGEKIDKLNFESDVIEIAKNEISNTAKMLREQVMERTRKHVYFLLPKITNNKYRDVKITEDFKVKVYSPEKNEYEDINSLSGGAMDQVLFSLRLAFTNAILGGRSRSKGFSLFLDEFLGSFDQSRRDETLKMLKDLKDDFRQIFLISHIDGMEGNVDQVIKTPEI